MDSASQSTDSPLARLHLFGAFQVWRGAEAVHLPTRKAEALLAYLALHSDSPHSREKLAALFWGDVSDEQARGSLRKALTSLRQALGPEIILADRQSIRLNAAYPLWVDAAAFERFAGGKSHPAGNAATDPAGELPASLDLYRGELLAEFYDDWILPLRERYRAAYLEGLLLLAQEMRTHSEYAGAIRFAQRTLAVDPANERAHQHLMFCYLALGRRNEALQQYEACKRLLEQELGVEPSRETTALYRWIKQSPPARAASEALITNLPIPASSFVGREDETAQVKRLLTMGERPGSDDPRLPQGDPEQVFRLVTLTGPGGSGKTRLAVRAATDLIDAFSDGVWWVELEALSDGAHVFQAVARALGVRESPDEPLLATLIAWLRSRRLLLVLDNCEHLVTVCASLAHELLSRCPSLKILATSRQALGLIGEQALPIPALAVPRRTRWPLVESLLNFEGVRLFVERAQAVRPDFSLTEQNAPAVLQICARLDGIPLALELAAMWLKTLSAEDVAARLDDRFNLLTVGSRVAPPRHQTLRGVLDWSYNLLEKPEQALFRRLSVFAGGWSPDAAQAVGAGESEEAARNSSGASPGLLHLLNRLVDKSLVITEHPPSRTRFRMLETIRAYGREKLQEAGEVEITANLHLNWSVKLGEEAERRLRGPEQGRWLETLDRELDNLRAALEWSLAHNLRQGLRLAGALTWYWNLRGHWSEGPVWLMKLLAHPDALRPTPERAKALVALANLVAWGSNDYLLARDRLEEALTVYRACLPVERWELGNALALYGEVLNQLNETAPARSALEESLAIGESLGEDGKWVCAWAWMGLAAVVNDPALRRERLERSAALFRALGDLAQLPVVLARLAWFHLGQKEYSTAQANAREAFTLTEQIGDVMGAAWMLKLSGDLALAQLDYDRAMTDYRDGLQSFRGLGSRSGIADALAGLGRALAAQGAHDQARSAWEEALVLYDEMGDKGSCAWLLEQLERLALESGRSHLS